MPSSLLRVGTWISLVVSGLAAQSTSVVSGGGGALNRAVQQATPGDRLIVRAGRYDALLVDRGLIIECDAGVWFAADLWQGGPSRIVGVPSAQCLVIRGGAITGGFASKLEIDRCAGIVTLVAPTLGAVQTVGQLEIGQCASVSIAAPRFPPPNFNGTDWRIAVTGSSVSVSDCSACAPLSAEASALALEDVSVVKSYGAFSLSGDRAAITVSGGRFPGSNFNIGLMSLPGIRLQASGLTITGGATATSGDGQIGLQGAIEGDVHSVVRLDPSVRLTAPGSPIQGAVAVRNETIAFLALPGQLRSGAPFDLRIHGASRDVVFVLLDLPGPAVLTPFGPLWVRPASPLFDVVTIPAGSTSVRSRYTVPSLPAALPLVLQPIRLGTGGDVTLGAARGVLVN